MRCAGDAKDIHAGICRGYRWLPTGSQGVRTNYRAYASEVVIQAASRQPKPGERKEVIYTLMPGIIPVQYRAEAGGACRVILGVDVQIELIPGGLGESHAQEDGPVMIQEHGKSSGTAAADYTPTIVADDCTN